MLCVVRVCVLYVYVCVYMLRMHMCTIMHMAVGSWLHIYVCSACIIYIGCAGILYNNDMLA